MVEPTRTLPPATLAAEATISAFGPICEAPATQDQAEISPDGNWIAMACRGKGAAVDSHLRVVSLHGDEDWAIHFADYARGEDYDSKNMVYPFHWSVDGRYLYAKSPSRRDGCCWLGGNSFLVRLNLKNGMQTDIVNYCNTYVPAVNFSLSPSDQYFLYIPQDDRGHLFILDLLTYKKRVIELDYKNTGAGYTLMSNNDEKIVLMLLEVPEEDMEYVDWDSLVRSIVLIDLTSGSQQKLISDMKSDSYLIPLRWQDDDHVLLTRDGQYWLLNVLTSELSLAENP
jgi:hypothetical protein